MRLAVYLGYIFAFVFALCGLLNTVGFCMYGSFSNAANFLEGLSEVLLTPAVGVVILLLVQILLQLNRMTDGMADRTLLKRQIQAKAQAVQPKQSPAHKKSPERYFPMNDAAPAADAPVEIPAENAEDREEMQQPAEEPQKEEETLQFFKLN